MLDTPPTIDRRSPDGRPTTPPTPMRHRDTPRAGVSQMTRPTRFLNHQGYLYRSDGSCREVAAICRRPHTPNSGCSREWARTMLAGCENAAPLIVGAPPVCRTARLLRSDTDPVVQRRAMLPALRRTTKATVTVFFDDPLWVAARRSTTSTSAGDAAPVC